MGFQWHGVNRTRVLINGKARLLLLVFAFAVAGSAYAQASSQSDFFAMQRMISDGYYATHSSVPTPG